MNFYVMKRRIAYVFGLGSKGRGIARYPPPFFQAFFIHARYSVCLGNILALLLACAPATAVAQETTSWRESILMSQAVEYPLVADRRVISRGNELLEIAAEAVKSLMPRGRQAAMEVVRVLPSDPATLYLRYVIGWVEFADEVRLDRPVDVADPGATEQLREQLKSKIHWHFLEKPILTQEEAHAALTTCDPHLQVSVQKLRPPFYNNWTGVRWNPTRDYLGLESNAVLDRGANQCVRGIVDLRTGGVVCKNVPCVVR